MRYLLLLVALTLTATIPTMAAQYVPFNTQREVVRLEPLIPTVIPISFEDVKLEVLTEELKYVIRNRSKETIIRVEGFLFLVDSTGTIKMYTGWVEADIKPYEKRKSGYNYLNLSEKQRNVLKGMTPQDRIFIVIREAKTKSGTWLIDDEELETAVKSKAVGRQFKMLHVEREHALRISAQDKSDLFKATFEHLFQDRGQLKYLGFQDEKNIILSTVNLGSEPVPNVSGINIIQMKPEEIQKKAELEGSVHFMYYSPPEVEGSRVYVSFHSTKNVRKGLITGWWGGVFTVPSR